MSLDYDLRNVKNYEELLAKSGDEKGMPGVMLKMLIFASMPIGMGSIKDEKEAIEFYSRVSFYEKVRGACRQQSGGYLVNGERSTPSLEEAKEIANEYLPAIVEIKEVPGIFPVYFTLDEVKRCIGLRTNVGKESTAAFLKKIYGNYARDVAYEAKKKGGE